MSTLSTTAAQRDIAGSGLFAALASAVGRWWQWRRERRAQRAAILQLRSMSDRELRDIGIGRSQIEFAVKSDFRREYVPSRVELSRAVT